MDIDKYDEYLRKPESDVVTVDTKIRSNNRGFAMLAKLGWVEGQPLGLSGDGEDPSLRTLSYCFISVVRSGRPRPVRAQK